MTVRVREMEDVNDSREAIAPAVEVTEGGHNRS